TRADTGIYNRVVPDASGAVWFNTDGYQLIRLDPVTGAITSLHLALKVPGTNWQNGGTWISAIAPDGVDVVIARRNVPYLTRVNGSMRVGGTIPLPAPFAGSDGLALSGPDLFVT